MKRNRTRILCLSIVFSLVSLKAFADPASTNYQIGESYFPSGSQNASSTNYQVADTALDSFGKSGLSSTNYAIDAKAGIAGGTNKIPVITSVVPGNLSRLFDDETPSFVVSVLNLDGDTLDYQAKQDGTLKDGPQSSSTLTWSISSSDVGRHLYKLEVVDPDGTVSNQQSGYIFRRPVK